jgi:hypothetical protein
MSQVVIGKTLKGLYAAIVAALSGLISVLGSNTTLSHVSAVSWITVAFAAVIAFGGVFGLAGWSGPAPTKP